MAAVCTFSWANTRAEDFRSVKPHLTLVFGSDLLVYMQLSHWMQCFLASSSDSAILYLQVILLNEDGSVLSSKYLKSVECIETGRDYEFHNYLVQICEPRALPGGKFPLVQRPLFGFFFFRPYAHILCFFKPIIVKTGVCPRI